MFQNRHARTRKGNREGGKVWYYQGGAGDGQSGTSHLTKPTEVGTSPAEIHSHCTRAGLAQVRAVRVSQKSTLPNKHVVMEQVQGQDRRLRQDQLQK